MSGDASQWNGSDVLVRLDGVVKHFPLHRAGLRGERDVVHALDGISLEVRRGETLGIVGESGSGKSTLARCMLRLQDVTGGRIFFEGEDITAMPYRRMRALRREMQMIFQDPFGALNPRRRVGSIIGDPIAIHTKDSASQRKRRVQELMELVGLNPEHYNRFPASSPAASGNGSAWRAPSRCARSWSSVTSPSRRST